MASALDSASAACSRGTIIILTCLKIIRQMECIKENVFKKDKVELF